MAFDVLLRLLVLSRDGLTVDGLLVVPPGLSHLNVGPPGPPAAALPPVLSVRLPVSAPPTGLGTPDNHAGRVPGRRGEAAWTWTSTASEQCCFPAISAPPLARG